jgi:excinuclease ABC subunit C
VLDDFEGLGPVRRAALLAHFGDIDRLRAANEAQLQEVEGIGPKLAAELISYLRSR